MRFELRKAGTVTECREALNAAIAALPLPYDTEHAAVRAIANHVVVDHLDQLHDPWQAEVNKARLAGMKPENFPAEPTTSIVIDVTVSYGQEAK